MLAFPDMIEPCAKEAEMKVPSNLEEYDATEFPHWHVFCAIQLGSPMPWPTAHWENAVTIAAIPDSEIMSVTYDQLIEKGLAVGNSSAYV